MGLLTVSNYARGLLAKLAQSGWRPLFGWLGGVTLLIALKFAYITAPLEGIQLPGEYYMGLNTALGLFLGAFVARGVEKYMERAGQASPPYTSPTGGLQNNQAIA